MCYFAGGKVKMSQCTFANYYLFAVPELPMLNVFNVEYSNGMIGKIRANFDNCILYSLFNDCQEINVGDLEDFDVYMR